MIHSSLFNICPPVDWFPFVSLVPGNLSKTVPAEAGQVTVLAEVYETLQLRPARPKAVHWRLFDVFDVKELAPKFRLDRDQPFHIVCMASWSPVAYLGAKQLKLGGITTVRILNPVVTRAYHPKARCWRELC